jgi:hypothetical protein
VKSFLHVCLSAMLAAMIPAHAEDKPNALERGVTKAGKSIEHTGDRAANATAHGLNTAGKWTGRQVERAGKAVGRAADNTTGWVKKKTE